jgi:hypothetical protein
MKTEMLCQSRCDYILTVLSFQDQPVVAVVKSVNDIHVCGLLAAL